ncbi:peptide-N(4)-(N-acetyl-beta-glucosaminyl)asparagine amidase isoform X2 [Cimex lectularius]|uniref:Peptide-N(4)-(N-acetyl-beta-glucosaminyl)asparagine amidase n=1 Tax=Cimex lectularius TaxID=79782 RepID=A0A8I6SQ91_CIMLE|nr:peptide-N(4)-(N-acetyl-beta-glucosaminyl)asparagine amidase isoform X2 [Cimex lectularius]
MDWKMVMNMMHMVQQYDSPSLQQKALDMIPKGDISRKASRKMRQLQNAMIKGKVQLDESVEYEKLFLEELAKWFKNDFFKWFNEPKCETCSLKTVFKQKMLTYFHEQGDVTVEIYKCPTCSRTYLFPRYSDADILLTQRTGRCSEWAQCFTLMCKALGWDSRFVYDVTDHVWTEIYSTLQQRWIHVDSCEAVVDQPLLYELGWKKKLSYVIAMDPMGIQDVSWRYSCNHKALRERRSLHFESQLLDKILHIRQKLQNNLSPSRLKFYQTRLAREIGELMCEPQSSNGTYSGRTSGSEEWRKARGELGCINSGYCWSPTPLEVDRKIMEIKYNCSMDVYKRSVTDESFNGWENFVFSYGNIFRKVESDWMKSYLAREENSDKGKISWKIDVSGSGLFIDKVVIKCSYLALEDAEVVWSVSSGGFEKEIDKISNDSHKPDPHLSGSQSAVAHPNFINERQQLAACPNIPTRP